MFASTRPVSADLKPQHLLTTSSLKIHQQIQEILTNAFMDQSFRIQIADCRLLKVVNPLEESDQEKSNMIDIIAELTKCKRIVLMLTGLSPHHKKKRYALLIDLCRLDFQKISRAIQLSL